MLERLRIAAFGELLWDLLPGGPQLGGAPANFAVNLSSMFSAATGLSGQVLLISRVGDDELGRAARQQIELRGVETSFLSTDPEHPTGTVDVELHEGLASYRIHEDAAWDHIPETLSMERLAPALNAVCFGTLAQRSPQTCHALRKLIESTSQACLRIFDINLRPPWWSVEALAWGCGVAGVLKMNLEEVPQLAQALDLDAHTEDPADVARSLLRIYPVQLVAITRGPHGSLIVTRDRVLDHPGCEAVVVDTVGAGDAFTAGLTLSLLRGDPLESAAETANRWGAWVASRPGGMPVSSSEERDKLLRIGAR